MFLISALIIVSNHHGWSLTKNDEDLSEHVKIEEVDSNDYVFKYLKKIKKNKIKHYRKPIQAAKLFLFFICPLLIFNFVGSILDMDKNLKKNTIYHGMDLQLKIIFGILQVIWITILIMWALCNNGFGKKK